jgi:hypothetical protein
VPLPGEPDAFWYLGFDCSHLFDLRPSDEAMMNRFRPERLGHPESVYRTLEWVKEETNRLAEQLAGRCGEKP